MAKASKKDMYLREVEILDLVRAGKNRSQIAEILHDKWNVTRSAIEKQHDKIIKEMSLQLREERESLRAELLEKTQFLYTKALANEKYKTALDTLIATAKIGGLFNERDEQREDRPQTIEIVEEDQSKPKLTSIKKAESN